MEGSTFLFMWLGFLVLMLLWVGGFFLWAVRSGQFSQQDEARYLALRAGIPPQPDPEDAAGSRSGGSL
jgi:nitrogen fixation-related uncharacterized protein